VSWEKDEETGETKKSQTAIGQHLQAIAYIEDTEQTGAAILLEFKTVRGQIRRWKMPRSGLMGNASALLDELVDRGYGLVYEQTRKLKRYLTELGQGIQTTYTITDKTGWVDGSFVLENRTYGDQSLRFRDVEPVNDSAYELRGTLESWRSEVAALCEGNSRLIFSMGVELAASLASIVEVDSGGFHLYGVTSTGKTTVLKVAASVSSIPSKGIKLWRATANGLEGIATAHNHLSLKLDEIGQAEPRDVGQSAYMLANGQGKTRARRNGEAIPAKQWNTLFLSSGEVPLTQYLKAAGIAVKGGQEIRMPDIPACPTGGHGVLESIGIFETAAEFIRALESAIERNCGTALDAFLTRLVEDRKSEDWVKTQVRRLWAISHKLREVAPTEEIIGRVSLRFALVQLALEVAHSHGILPFPVEQCSWAVQTLFTDWIEARGGAGSLEIKQACDRVEHIFVSNEFSDRVLRLGEAKGGEQEPDETSLSPQTVRNLLAYRKFDVLTGESEFWVPSSVFVVEFCQGIDKAQLISELLAREWLKPSTQADRHTLKRKLGRRDINVYVFKIFWDNAKTTGVTGATGVALLDKASSRSRSENTNGSHGSHPQTEINGGQLSIDKNLYMTPVTPVDKKTTGAAETLAGEGDSRRSRDSRPGTAKSENIFDVNGEDLPNEF
jgi:putative DNA primase/helicase